MWLKWVVAIYAPHFIQECNWKFSRVEVHSANERLRLIEEQSSPRILFFRFINGGNTVGDLLKSLLLKPNDSYCFSNQSRERDRGMGESPQKFLNPHLFRSKETPYLIKRALQKVTFIPLLKRGGI